MVEMVEIFVKQRRPIQPDAVQQFVAVPEHRKSPLISGVVNGEMMRHARQKIIAQIKRNQPHVIIVAVNGVEIPLPDVTRHRL